jgi:hypothetical protein
MKPATSRAAPRIPRRLVYTTLGCVLACTTAPAEPGRDASADVAIADAGLVDGCIYQLCNGPDASPTCPGVVCLPPTEHCPPGCEPVI